MPKSNSRLLVEIEKAIRDVNRGIINPKIKELELTDLTPVLEMVARARGAYLKELIDMASMTSGSLPTTDHIKKLRHLRITYEELVNASSALETAIERGYLDVGE